MVDIAFEKLKDRDAETSAKLVERRQNFLKKSKEHQRNCFVRLNVGDVKYRLYEFENKFVLK